MPQRCQHPAVQLPAKGPADCCQHSYRAADTDCRGPRPAGYAWLPMPLASIAEHLHETIALGLVRGGVSSPHDADACTPVYLGC